MRIDMMVTAVLLLCAAAPAAAEDTPQSALDDAKILARKGDRMKAAERYGDAVALAQAAGDMQAEEAVADSMQKFFDDAARDAMTDTGAAATHDTPLVGALLAAAMRKLDPNRCGAFVSAPVLARNVLELATETGDFASVADAANVAASGARTTSGRAAAVVAKYAVGLQAVTEKKLDLAAPSLDAASAEAASCRWLDLCAHAGTEAAVSWLGASSPEKAAASMSAVAAAFIGNASWAKANEWGRYAHKRLAGAPESVGKPLEDLLAKGKGGGSVSAGGGRGGRGGAAGAAGTGPPMSDVARLLAKLAPGKPFVSVTCGARGLDIHWATAPDERTVKKFEEKVGVADEGGVTLCLNERSVALRMVDLEGRNGQPGESAGGRAPVVRAFYLLAEGETWAVSKDGIVTITR
jgi:hypothetical protein